MKKKERYFVSIHLDIVTAAYLETLLYCSGKSSISLVVRDLIKDGFDEHFDIPYIFTYTGDLLPEFDAFPQTKQYFIRLDVQSVACLDIFAGELTPFDMEPVYSWGELGQSHSDIIRWLVIREFTKLQSTLRQSIHQTEIS